MTEPVIDTLVYNEIAELMGDAMSSFIETYLDNSPKLLKGMSQALPEEDIEALVHNAHQLKGGSGSIGVMQVFRLSKQLEEDGRAGNTDNLSSVFAELKAAYLQAEAELRVRL